MSTTTWKWWRLYTCYRNMIHRCHKPGFRKYEFYGAKGIAVCEEWRRGFSVFKTWAISNGYTDDLTIDRIDSKRGYEPENCRWIPFKANMQRRFGSVDVEATNGIRKAWQEGKTSGEIAEQFGISRSHAWAVATGKLSKWSTEVYVVQP